jgi:putative hemolysin
MLYVELLILALLTAINGLLAMSEMAIASSRMSKLKSLAEQNVKGANRAMALASDPGRFLSSVQIGITLVGIIAGAISGATLGVRLSDWLEGIGVPDRLAEPFGFGAVIGLITYFSLIIGELVPKQLALRNPERIACLVSPGMTLLARIAAPIVWLLDRSGRLVLRLLGKNRVKDDTVTDAEIHSLIAEAESAGVIEPEERSMIAGVMRLGDRPVRTVMIPRADVEMINVQDDFASIGKQIAKSGYSRYVVHDGNPENIIGVVQARDIAASLLQGRKRKLKQMVKPAPIFPDTVDALDVVEKLKASEVHLGLIYDEHGHFEGVVTAADILETIVGAFKEEKRPVEPEIVERADGSFLISGWAPVDSVMPQLALPVPEKRDYQTMAGFVLDHLGHLPETGQSFDHKGYSFEVVDLDGRRIDKILASRKAVATHRLKT